MLRAIAPDGNPTIYAETQQIVITSYSIHYTKLYERLPFEHLTVRGGLASNYVTTLAQDAMGRLWMATSDGVSIYDGEQCRTLTKRDGLRDT